MALYELVFIARNDLSAEDVDKLSDKLTKILTDKKGKLISKEYWGLRNLAYKINKSTRGHYVLLNIEAEIDAVNELRRVVGFEEAIVRSNIFQVEEHQSPSNLMLCKNAKDYKDGKTTNKADSPKNSSEIDEKIDQIVINNL